jgi:tRNA pseudouridine55 synthase
MTTTRQSSPRDPSIHGILLVDKAQGWTSHDAVAKTRGITRQRKIGHTGTLDPMATGLLVLCIGDATRLVEYMTGHEKRYEGEITLGLTTDTDDAEGSVIHERPVPAIDAETLAGLQRRFTGVQLQRPPAYSAVKVAGKRAYAVARAGGEVEIAPREVRVFAIELRQLAADRLAVSVHCGPGTYIRSLARDIGEVLGCGAHLSALRRTTVGRFSVTDARSLDEIATLVAAGGLEEALWSPDEGIGDYAAAIVEEHHAASLAHGALITNDAWHGNAPAKLRIYDNAGSFHGVGYLDEFGTIRPLKVLANAR